MTNTRDNRVLGIQAILSNTYDGNHLAGIINQTEIISDGLFGVSVDHQYGGPAYVGEAENHLTGKKTIALSKKRWLNRRNAIEQVIGHLKTDNGLYRNFVMGEGGDWINTILASCGFNFRNFHRAILFYLFIFKAESSKYGKLLKILTRHTQLWICRHLDSEIYMKPN